jgi:hypothetical protein
MRSFFSMGRGERPLLVFLLVFSAFTFLPSLREIEVGGMVLFGWLMASLILLSPLVALIACKLARRED